MRISLIPRISVGVAEGFKGAIDPFWIPDNATSNSLWRWHLTFGDHFVECRCANADIFCGLHA